jgi:hypothetical protein
MGLAWVMPQKNTGRKNILGDYAKNYTLCVSVILLIAQTGCMAKNGVTPADRVKNETFRYDCCDPALSSGTKEMCDMAKSSTNHTLIDNDKNRYEFVWSDCEVGKEPWRKWE